MQLRIVPNRTTCSLDQAEDQWISVDRGGLGTCHGLHRRDDREDDETNRQGNEHEDSDHEEDQWNAADPHDEGSDQQIQSLLCILGHKSIILADRVQQHQIQNQRRKGDHPSDQKGPMAEGGNSRVGTGGIAAHDQLV